MANGTVSRRLTNLSPPKRALLEKRLKEKRSEFLAKQTIRPRAPTATAPLSFAQERLWILNQLDPESPAYNESRAVRLSGPLDVDALRQALNQIVARHEVLRTTIVAVDGTPMQLIAPSRMVELPLIDLRTLTDKNRDAEAHRLLIDATRRPFDLSRDLMLRVLLVRLADQKHILLSVKHHVASDGWSSGIFWREVVTLYAAFSSGQTADLPELPIQYADYADWQREWLQGEVLETQRSYWRKQLDNLSTLQLPTDRPRPAIQTFRGARQTVVLSKNVAGALKVLSRKEGVTLFMTLLAAFQALLHRYTGQEDIAVGSLIAGRNRAEIEGLIGFFVNTLVLRTDVSGNPTFTEFLERVRGMCLGAYAHQELPFEKLVEELQPARHLDHNPLFQVVFQLNNGPRTFLKLPAISAEDMNLDGGISKFDLSLSMTDNGEDITGRFRYNTDLFNADTIERMLGHFQTLLEGILANPEQRISELPLLTESERHQLLVEWNDTKTDYPKDKCIHELFETQVEKTPDAVALVFEDQQLTYRELNCRTNQLAHYLQKLGVGPDVLVGICMERSLELVVGLMGILKAGAAYLPLDPQHPKHRLAFMLNDTEAKVLLTQNGFLSNLPDYKTSLVCLDRDSADIALQSDVNLASNVTAKNLAYVIYTSGTTGVPKGVMIEHQSVVNYLTWFNQDVLREDLECLPVVTSPAFDASLKQLFGPLLRSGSVWIVPEEARNDATALVKTFSTRFRSGINCVPSLWTALLDVIECNRSMIPDQSISALYLGGEQLDSNLIHRTFAAFPEIEIWNLYGPTEATANCVAGKVTHERQITLGRPVANAKVYILDKHLNPVPVGIPGEICIGGDGLARGYLNQPVLTNEKFVANPFSNVPGERFYKTGDLARYLPDGNVEFLRRIDDQVKIRGYRIELREIEITLQEHPDVQAAVAIVRENTPGDRRLTAYVLPRGNSTPSPTELKTFVKQKLPEYMIPAAFMFLTTLPLTSNGKIDRGALPPPDQSSALIELGYVKPRTLLEQSLAEIWGEVLNLEKVGVEGNFFELGGHSLLGIKVISQLRRKFGVDLPVRTLFEAPTIAQLAARLQRQTKPVVSSNGKATYSHLLELRSGPNQTPIFCFPYRCGVQGEYTHFLRLAGYMSEYSFYGLQAKAADSHTPPHATVEELATNYVREIEDFEPNGPYYLIGDCAGAPEAYETARQLWTRGKRVGLLMLLDARGPYLPGSYWRLGPYSIKDLDLLRSRLLKSRLGMWCRNLEAAISFHWQESKKLPKGERRRYLAAKALKRLKTQFGVSQEYSSEPSQELEDDFLSASEKQLLKHIYRVRRQYRSNRPRDYGGRLAVIVNEQWYGIDRTFGWAEMAAGGIETYGIPGDHISYMLEHVPLVADQLRACLEKAR